MKKRRGSKRERRRLRALKHFCDGMCDACSGRRDRLKSRAVAKIDVRSAVAQS